MGEGQSLYLKAKGRIPGGTQLLSKRPEMFLPDQWPSYYSRAKGAEVWDLDGRQYLDMSYMGIGSCVLGAADPEVDEAVVAAVRNGSMSTLNAAEEVRLAELLCELHPWAEMVRYSRSGGEAVAMAVRIARAATGRDKVAFCGYHGWHDWYLAANLAEDKALDGHLLPGLAPKGVPRGLLGTARPFRYNRLDELNQIIEEAKGELAAIVMEPIRDHGPEPGFLEGVRAAATKIGAAFIIDEVSAGFRLIPGGAHLTLNLEPDVAVFAKAMSNGYAMSAVIGRRAVMQAAQETFISSTYWTDRVGPTAALAAITKFRREQVHRHLIRVGQSVQAGWREAGQRHGLAVEADGIPPLSHLSLLGEDSRALHTLYTQLMLERGILATRGFYASLAHTGEHLERFLAALDEVFPILARARAENQVSRLLQGPLAHTGFHRLT